jgi:hypothetical protein
MSSEWTVTLQAFRTFSLICLWLLHRRQPLGTHAYGMIPASFLTPQRRNRSCQAILHHSLLGTTTCVHTCAHAACTHVHTHTCTGMLTVCMHTNMRVYICRHVSTCSEHTRTAHMCVHTCSPSICMHRTIPGADVHTHTHTHMYAHMPAHRHSCRHSHAHTCMVTLARMYTPPVQVSHSRLSSFSEPVHCVEVDSGWTLREKP